MSVPPRKEILQGVYYLVVIFGIPMIGFFLVRLVNLVDTTVDRQQRLEISTMGISKDVDDLKKFQERSINMFFDYVNRKEKQDKMERDSK